MFTLSLDAYNVADTVVPGPTLETTSIEVVSTELTVWEAPEIVVTTEETLDVDITPITIANEEYAGLFIPELEFDPNQ